MGALAYVFVVVAGALNAIGPGSNTQLSKSLDRPWLTALMISLVTTTVFGIAFLVTGARLPESGHIAGTPWWAWIGGLFGAAYVAGSLFFAGQMGAGLFTGLTVTAGIVGSLALDHFGLVGFEQHSASWPRIAGAAAMIAGLALVARF